MLSWIVQYWPWILGGIVIVPVIWIIVEMIRAPLLARCGHFVHRRKMICPKCGKLVQ